MRPRTLLTVIACIMAFLQVISAKGQDIPSVIKKVYSLIDNGKYSDGYKLIRDIGNEKVEAYGDSMVVMLNYEKGACLYFLDKYKEAIPFFECALFRTEKLPHEDCKYLELIYSIGSCYKNLKQYRKAEEYFRRVIIRGDVQDFQCSITTTTFTELAEVYNKLGYPKLAKACVEKIKDKIEQISGRNWNYKKEELEDLADAYEEQKEYDKEIETLRAILDLLAANVGKENDEYILYSNILRLKLILLNRTDEAIPLCKDMIRIGRNKKSNVNICEAYSDYLEILASKDSIKQVLSIIPKAIKYMKSNPEYDIRSHNLYEVIGNGFFKANNFETGADFLERKWYGQKASTIRSLTNLGSFYFKKNPAKALTYFKEAARQIDIASNDETKKSIYENLMYLSSNLKLYSEACKYAKLAAPFIRQLNSKDYYAYHLVSWSLDLINSNQVDSAKLLLKEMRDMLPELSDDKTKIVCYSQYGFAKITMGELSDAIISLKEGIGLAVQSEGESCILLPTMYHNLGRAYMLQKDYCNALLWLNKSKGLQIQLNGTVRQRTLDYIKECEAK